MMLVAVAEDVSQIEGLCPTVLVSPLAAEFLEGNSVLPQSCRRMLCDSGPLEWLLSPAIAPPEFAATMVIAPESGGVLAESLKILQGSSWAAVRNFNVPWSLADLFTDKFATFQWLRRNGFETPETKTLCDKEADRLRAGSTGWFEAFSRNGFDLETIRSIGVIKPRDGAGSDAISFVPMEQKTFDSLPSGDSPHDRWIIQPFLGGSACSIGLIGGGCSSPATVLLPAQQNLIVKSGGLIYTGGQIPCDAQVANVVTLTGRRLAEALGSFSGYLGADIVVTESDRGEQTAHVIEINPRLCTSYVGYRALSVGNLMEFMLSRDNSAPLWKPGTFVFSTG